jgi:hypothetical protein
MSRRLGTVQRMVLEVLKDGDRQSAGARAKAATGQPFPLPESTYRSVARALRSLVRIGLVKDLEVGWQRGCRVYELPDAADAYQARVQSAFGETQAPSRKLLT